MSDTSKREELIEEAAKAGWDAWNGRGARVSGSRPPSWDLAIRVALAVFEQAHAKELDTSPEPVKNGADSLHVEQAHTPTDDEREALARIIEKVFLTTPHGARRYVEDIVAMPEWPFRRTAVQEPSAEPTCTHPGHGKRLHECELPPIEPQGEPSAKFIPGSNGAITVPNGEPSDAQVEAALEAFYGTKKAAHMWDRREDMRAALRAAAGAGQEEKR